MKTLLRVLCAVLLVMLLASAGARAQKFKWGKVPKAFKSAQLQRTLLNAPKRPDIRLSVARLDHTVCLNLPMNKRPHSTAFLFTTYYKEENGPWASVFNPKGTKVVWAVTAGHTAQLGEKVRLTFYNGKKEIPVDGTLVQHGPALLSDAALIKIDTPLPAELRPLELTTEIDPQEKLTSWGYASNKLYKIDKLTFEKDNTRFIRTDFPAKQKKRSGLCGGPLLNKKGQAIGIHCGSTLEDKSYASNVRIIPYLLQAYYEGNAEIPLIAKGIEFGSINLNERILYIQCMDEHGHLLNEEDIYEQLPQSLVMSLYQDPEVRYLRFLLVANPYIAPTYRVLVYDKKTATHHFEPFRF